MAGDSNPFSPGYMDIISISGIIHYSEYLSIYFIVKKVFFLKFLIILPLNFILFAKDILRNNFVKTIESLMKKQRLGF